MDFDALRAEFQETGSALLPKLLDAEALKHCRDCYDWAMENPLGGVQLGGEHDDAGFYDQDPASNQLGSEARLAASRSLLEACPVFAKVCLEIWGSSKNVWLYDIEQFKKTGGGTTIASKKTGQPMPRGRRSPFHQDTSYIPFEGDHLAAFWITFEGPVPKQNSLEVVAGSQSQRGTLFNGSTFQFHDETRPVYNEKVMEEAGLTLPRLPDVRADPGRYEIRSWALDNKGDVVLFHPGCLHGGAPVDAGFPERHTLVIRFFGDDCKYRLLPRVWKGKFYKGNTLGEHYSLTRQSEWLHLSGPGLARL